MERYLTKNFGKPNAIAMAGYLKHGGYRALRKVLKKMEPKDVVEEVKDSGLRGRGGAGFPTGLKWSFMPQETDGPKYIACNADESEPGTFKDREFLEKEPQMMIEGLIISAYAMGVNTCYIYIRGEYATQTKILQQALAEAYEEKFLGRQPRKKPPFPANFGLWGRPTTVNNVETFAQVPHIINKGASWFRGIGTEKSTGNTIFGVSGHVNKPGAYELPLGYGLKDLIYKDAGGIRNGRELKAVIPGGSSVKVLPADRIDVPLDHDSLTNAGSSLGTGGVIVMDDTTCMVRVGVVLAHFYRHESCGQCTNCREGSAWLHQLMVGIENGQGKIEDLDLLMDVADSLEGSSICALADAAAWPVQGLVTHFRDEFEEHIKTGKCTSPDSFRI